MAETRDKRREKREERREKKVGASAGLNHEAFLSHQSRDRELWTAVSDDGECLVGNANQIKYQ